MSSILTKDSGEALVREIKDLPGPRGIPVLGNLLQLKMSRIHRDMEKWSHEHGPFFKVRLGRKVILVVADHEAIGTILRDRPDGFRRPSGLAKTGNEFGAVGLFSAEGDTWRHQRRMVMSSFGPGQVKGYFPSLVKVAARLMRCWESSTRKGDLIDLQGDLKRYSVDITAGLAFGCEVDSFGSEGNIAHKHFDVILAEMFKRTFAVFPYWRYVKLPADRRLDESRAAMSAAITAYVREARERINANPALRENPRNLLEAMLVAADLPDSFVDERSVAGNVGTMLLVGEDTTATTLAWLIYLMARNPRTLKLAQEEVRRLAPRLEEFSTEQMDSLTYLDACANEAMRLKPVAPFSSQEAIRDTTIKGVRIPAGTLVWCVMRHDSHSDRYFPRAEKFEPERWLAHGDQGPDKRVSMPFGAGPRVCPGRYLAMMEIKIAMAALLGKFDVQEVETPDRGEAQELMSFTMVPVGLRLRLREGG